MLFLWVNLAMAESRKPASKELRLTWSPTKFLEEGYRSAPWVKDPFFPELNVFRLSGVISNELAYINGKWYRLGDKISSYFVKQIAADGVVLMDRVGATLTLKMEEQ